MSYSECNLSGVNITISVCRQTRWPTSPSVCISAHAVKRFIQGLQVSVEAIQYKPTCAEDEASYTEPELQCCCRFFLTFPFLTVWSEVSDVLCASLRLRCSAWEVAWKIKSSSVALLGCKKTPHHTSAKAPCESTLQTNKACAVGRENREACWERSLKLSGGYSCELLQKYPRDSLQGSWRYCEKTSSTYAWFEHAGILPLLITQPNRLKTGVIKHNDWTGNIIIPKKMVICPLAYCPNTLSTILVNVVVWTFALVKKIIWKHLVRCINILRYAGVESVKTLC